MFPSSQPPRLYGRDWLLPMEAYYWDRDKDEVAQKPPDDVHHNETRKTKATSTVLIAELRNTPRRLASKSWVIPNVGNIPNQKNRKAATTVGIHQITSSSSSYTGREEETKSQVVYGRAAIAHRGEKRKEDTSPGKSNKWMWGN